MTVVIKILQNQSINRSINQNGFNSNANGTSRFIVKQAGFNNDVRTSFFEFRFLLCIIRLTITLHHLLRLVCSSPERREDAVCPVVGGDVETTKHLRRRDRFGVHVHLLVRLCAGCERLHQHADALRLAGT